MHFSSKCLEQILAFNGLKFLSKRPIERMRPARHLSWSFDTPSRGIAKNPNPKHLSLVQWHPATQQYEPPLDFLNIFVNFADSAIIDIMYIFPETGNCISIMVSLWTRT